MKKKSTGHVSESTDHLQKMDGCLVHNSRWAKEVLNEANAWPNSKYSQTVMTIKYSLKTTTKGNNLRWTCPKGFGLKIAKLGLKIQLKNKVKQKQSKAKLSQAEQSWKVRKSFGKGLVRVKGSKKGLIGKRRKERRRKGKRGNWQNFHSICKEGIRTRQGFGELKKS